MRAEAAAAEAQRIAAFEAGEAERQAQAAAAEYAAEVKRDRLTELAAIADRETAARPETPAIVSGDRAGKIVVEETAAPPETPAIVSGDRAGKIVAAVGPVFAGGPPAPEPPVREPFNMPSRGGRSGSTQQQRDIALSKEIERTTGVKPLEIINGQPVYEVETDASGNAVVVDETGNDVRVVVDPDGTNRPATKAEQELLAKPAGVSPLLLIVAAVLALS